MAMALVNGNEKFISNDSCTKPAQVQAIIGETYSSVSMAVANSIGPFSVPIVSISVYVANYEKVLGNSVSVILTIFCEDHVAPKMSYKCNLFFFFLDQSLCHL